MIRMNPMHDTVNPPGQVKPTHMENTLDKNIQEYTDDMLKEEIIKVLKEAYIEGYKKGLEIGLQIGYQNAVNKLQHIDPNSEEAR